MRLTRSPSPPARTPPPRAPQIPGLKTTYEILKAGQGGVAIAKGSQGTLHATGVVKESGKKFWCARPPCLRRATMRPDVVRVPQVDQGPGPAAVHLPVRRGAGHHGVGPGLPRHDRGRGAQADHPGG